MEGEREREREREREKWVVGKKLNIEMCKGVSTQILPLSKSIKDYKKTSIECRC